MDLVAVLAIVSETSHFTSPSLYFTSPPLLHRHSAYYTIDCLSLAMPDSSIVDLNEL